MEDYQKLSMDEKIQLFYVNTITESELPNVILDYLIYMEVDFETAYDE